MISLRGLRRLIWVDTLVRGHNVGFLAGRLICEKSVATDQRVRHCSLIRINTMHQKAAKDFTIVIYEMRRS